MTTELNNILPKELNNIVFEYVSIESWLINFTERYIKEYFGSDICDILNIKKLSIQAIPNFESVISSYERYNEVLPWDLKVNIDDSTEVDDAWSKLGNVIMSVTNKQIQSLFYLYPPLQKMENTFSRLLYDDHYEDDQELNTINNKYINELYNVSKIKLSNKEIEFKK